MNPALQSAGERIRDLFAWCPRPLSQPELLRMLSLPRRTVQNGLYPLIELGVVAATGYARQRRYMRAGSPITPRAPTPDSAGIARAQPEDTP